MLKTTREEKYSTKNHKAQKTKTKHSQAHVFLRELITMNKQIDRVLTYSLKQSR